MEFLRARDMVEPDVVELLGNRLVVAVRANGPAIRSMQDLATPLVERLAIADPELAPAGSYAREALRRLGPWALKGWRSWPSAARAWWRGTPAISRASAS